MLGSGHAGERDNAAQAAHRLVTTAGLTWHQVLAPPPVTHRLPELGTWRQTRARLLARPGSLRAWKLSFVRDLPKFLRLPTKQRYCLKQIADRVLGEDRG